MGKSKQGKKEGKNQGVPVELLEYAKSIFDRYAGDFDHLDNKSLGIMGIVGLLVSFQALSFDNLLSLFCGLSNNQSSYLLYITIFFLLIHAVSLLVSISFALCAFQVRDIEYPTDVLELVERYRRIDEEEKAMLHLKVDIVKTYANSIGNLDRANVSKAKHLKRSLIAIFVAIISLGVFLVSLLIYRSNY